MRLRRKIGRRSSLRRFPEAISMGLNKRLERAEYQKYPHFPCCPYSSAPSAKKWEASFGTNGSASFSYFSMHCDQASMGSAPPMANRFLPGNHNSLSFPPSPTDISKRYFGACLLAFLCFSYTHATAYNGPELLGIIYIHIRRSPFPPHHPTQTMPLEIADRLGMQCRKYLTWLAHARPRPTPVPLGPGIRP